MNKGADINNEIKKKGETKELVDRKNKQYLEKNDAINNLIHFREKYYEIDREYKEEIGNNIKKKKKKN